MKRLILYGGLALVTACASPSANNGSALAASTGAATVKPEAKPVATAAEAAPAAARETPALAANPAPLVPVKTVREITIPAGTVLPVDLETTVGSDISHVEEPVAARLRHALTVNGVEVLPAGTAVNGYVSAAERPGKVKGLGHIAMRFTKLDTPGAGTTTIATETIGRTAASTKKKDAVKIGAPAGVGAIIGGIAGGGKGAAVGAAIGGGAGTGYVLSTRGKEVRIEKGADLSVKLTAPVTVRVAS